LEIVSNDAGTESQGLGILVRNKQIKKITASYIGENQECVQQYIDGFLEVQLTPQVFIFF
jgi:3-oxoacid CoA-transferase subunit A